MSALTMTENRPQQIVDGDKWLTFRLAAEGDTFRHGDGKTTPDAVISWKRIAKWRVGGIVPIKPGRILPGCIVDPNGKVVKDVREEYVERRGPGFIFQSLEMSLKAMRDWLLSWDIFGYRLLQVEILSLRKVDVRDMTDADAIGAGFADAYSYLKWWTKTYDRQVWREEQTRDFRVVTDYDVTTHVAGWRDWMKQARPAAKYTAWRIEFKRHVS